MNMARTDESITFERKELSGSRLRCLMLTACPARQFAAILNELVSPIAKVAESDVWMPKGLLEPEEAKLGECPKFLTPALRETLTSWWLQVRRNANTPNWDLVSTCTIEGRPGLVIVEAKAHNTEAKPEGKIAKDAHPGNHEQIGSAIAEANEGLNKILPGFALSRDSHYQLCNRFAWAWKLATLGVPTVLVYLGFLDADEMTKSTQRSFSSAADWDHYIREHSQSLVPSAAWGQRLQTPAAPMWAVIRSRRSEWMVEKRELGAHACP